MPTSLALTSSLLATSLPRPQCKKHLAAFSASTPIAAVLTYLALSFFGGNEHPDWPGIALLLSVRTKIRPVSLVPHSNCFTGRNFPQRRDIGFSSFRGELLRRDERQDTSIINDTRHFYSFRLKLRSWAWPLVHIDCQESDNCIKSHSVLTAR